MCNWLYESGIWLLAICGLFCVCWYCLHVYSSCISIFHPTSALGSSVGQDGGLSPLLSSICLAIPVWPPLRSPVPPCPRCSCSFSCLCCAEPSRILLLTCPSPSLVSLAPNSLHSSLYPFFSSPPASPFSVSYQSVSHVGTVTVAGFEAWLCEKTCDWKHEHMPSVLPPLLHALMHVALCMQMHTYDKAQCGQRAARDGRSNAWRCW